MGHKKALPDVASALPCQFLLYPLKTTKRARPIPVALIYTHRHTHTLTAMDDDSLTLI